MINHLSTQHFGNMPIRVLQYNLTHQFENINTSFSELTKKVMAEQGLDNGIGYQIEMEKVKSPYAVFNKITVQETFLSYVWCMSFSLTSLYEEVIVKKSKNDFLKSDQEKIDLLFYDDAYALWKYGISLLNEYSDWDINLPNPEQPQEKYDDLIQKINALYLVAMNFILAHEFAHIELEHATRENKNDDPLDFNKKIEKEADDRAIQLVLEGTTAENATTNRMGILIGLCSLLFFKSTTEEHGYPDVDNRIDAIISIINPEPSDAMWGIANLAYRLWDIHYGKGLKWEEGLYSPKDLYFSIKAQVERKQTE